MNYTLFFTVFRKVYISLIAFVIILLSGTIGYMYLEHFNFIDAFYMTVITLSTVGFTEVRPLDDSGKIFTVILILVNLGTFAFFVTELSSYFLQGEFIATYKFLKMKESIDKLDGHIIICGFGRNGREAARVLSQNKKQFVAIEKIPVRKDDLTFEVHHYLEDDATRDETLLQAGIMRAEALITTLADDADNLFVVLTARELNPALKIISRASHDTTVKKLKSAGASSVVMPDKIGGAHMASMILSPGAKEFIDIMSNNTGANFEIAEVVSSKTISIEELNCWAQTGATILGLKGTHGEYLLNPSAKTLVHAGNRLVVMGSHEQVAQLKKRLLN